MPKRITPVRDILVVQRLERAQQSKYSEIWFPGGQGIEGGESHLFRVIAIGDDPLFRRFGIKPQMLVAVTDHMDDEPVPYDGFDGYYFIKFGNLRAIVVAPDSSPEEQRELESKRRKVITQFPQPNLSFLR